MKAVVIGEPSGVTMEQIMAVAYRAQTKIIRLTEFTTNDFDNMLRQHRS